MKENVGILLAGNPRYSSSI